MTADSHTSTAEQIIALPDLDTAHVANENSELENSRSRAFVISYVERYSKLKWSLAACDLHFGFIL